LWQFLAQPSRRKPWSQRSPCVQQNSELLHLVDRLLSVEVRAATALLFASCVPPVHLCRRELGKTSCLNCASTAPATMVTLLSNGVRFLFHVTHQ
jgi:hypothetical protein